MPFLLGHPQPLDDLDELHDAIRMASKVKTNNIFLMFICLKISL